MQRYYGIVRSFSGAALAGSSVYIYSDDTGTNLADIYDVNGDALSNPVTTNSRGAVDVYSASPRLWYKVSGDTVYQPIQHISISPSVYNVIDYGAVGDGVTDDTAAINNACTAAQAAGGGKVYLPTGTYIVHLWELGETGIYTCIQLTDGNIGWMQLCGDGPGSIIKLQDDEPVGSDTPAWTSIVRAYVDYSAGYDGWPAACGIEISDLTIDGNAANQTEDIEGIYLVGANGARINNVTVNHIHGSPEREAMAFSLYRCVDTQVSNCQALGIPTQGTPYISGTGFSDAWCTGTQWLNCVGDGWDWVAFTTHKSASILYSNCAARRSGWGFNCEYSKEVVYSHCATGTKMHVENPQGDFTAEEAVGNWGHGMAILGCTHVTVSNCILAYNGKVGLKVWTATASEDIVVSGGIIAHNTEDGVNCGSAITESMYISPETLIADNGYYGFYRSSTIRLEGDGASLVTPSVPASTVTATNTYPFNVGVFISGGTYTQVTLGGGSTNIGPVSYAVVKPGETIAITYSSVPTWVWRRV